MITNEKAVTWQRKNSSFFCYLFCCKVNSLYFIFKLIRISFIIWGLLYYGISKEMGKRTGREWGGGKRVGRDQLNIYIYFFFSKIRYAHISVWRAYAALDVDPKPKQCTEQNKTSSVIISRDIFVRVISCRKCHFYFLSCILLESP